MTERPFLGGPIPDLTNRDFFYRNGELYWRASYVADRLLETFEFGKIAGLEKKLNGEAE